MHALKFQNLHKKSTFKAFRNSEKNWQKDEEFLKKLLNDEN